MDDLAFAIEVVTLSLVAVFIVNVAAVAFTNYLKNKQYRDSDEEDTE